MYTKSCRYEVRIRIMRIMNENMNPEEKGSRLLWNVGITLPNHKVSHPRQSQLSMHIKADVNFQKNVFVTNDLYGSGQMRK